MLHSVRSALRDRVVRAVQEANAQTVTALTGQLDAVRDQLDAVRADLARLAERIDQVDGGLRQELHGWERRQRRDVLTAADQEAMRTSAAFFGRELSTATAHFHKHDTLRAALDRVSFPGLYLEFGVATGSTLRVITDAAPAGSVYGFDSFEGLPEHWRMGYSVGQFATAELPDVPGAELVVGLFDATLDPFLEAHPEPVAFLHVDADLYSSTVTVLDALAPRMRAGTVIVFDEYFNFPGWEDHEHRAWTEFVAATGLQFEYLGFTADDEQVAVRLLTAPAQAPGDPGAADGPAQHAEPVAR